MNNTDDTGAAAPPAFSFPTADRPEEGEKVHKPAGRQPEEDQLDDAIAHSFPASDPVSVTVSPVPSDDAKKEERKTQVGKNDAGTSPALPASAGFWTAAFLSTAVVGIGAVLFLQRQRSPARRLARLVPADAWKPIQRAVKSAHLPRGRWL